MRPPARIPARRGGERPRRTRRWRRRTPGPRGTDTRRSLLRCRTDDTHGHIRNSLMTKTLIAGIGCRRNVSADQIDAALRATLGTRSLAEIREIATVDTKANEPGLREFCARHALPLRLFTLTQIAAVPIAPPARSAAARAHLGIDGVCEPCAQLAAPHGHLIVGKTVHDGVTVALVADPLTGFTPSASTDQDLDR